MTPTLHLIEPGGGGGVFQHAATLGAALVVAGVPVVLHTAAEAEDMPGPPVPRHVCFWRRRSVRLAGVRRAAIAAGWLTMGVPGMVRRFRPGDVVQIEGRLLRALMVPVVVAARARRCRVIYSPHNTFARGRAGARGAREDALVAWMARRADAVLAFSEHDRRLMQGWGARVVRVPLASPPVSPDPALVASWRRRWESGDGRRVALLAGQLRPDKGLDIAVRAAARWREGVVLAVVGEDIGALAPALRLARDLGVDVVVDEGFQPLQRFVAAVAAADVVVCPYRVGSQSAVLTMAAALGRPTVASAVGGLEEVATITVPAEDADALAAGVARAVAAGPQPVRKMTSAELVAPFLEVYRRWTASPAPAGAGST